MKTLKPTEELISDLLREIAITKLCMKKQIKNGDLQEALVSKNSVETLEFVIELAEGNLD